MRGLKRKIYSNRRLSKRFKTLNKISFKSFSCKDLSQVSSLRTIPYDTHILEVTDSNYVYRACINEGDKPFESVSRISYNPNPQNMSRANLKGQAVGYYACAADIAIIEGCQDLLRNTGKREFSLTVGKWKIKREFSIQIISNSKKTQQAGTDLNMFWNRTKEKRFNDLRRKYFRTYFLKTQFIAAQYSKTDIEDEKDYAISALHAKTILNGRAEIDGIIYPSVGYFF